MRKDAENAAIVRFEFGSDYFTFAIVRFESGSDYFVFVMVRFEFVSDYFMFVMVRLESGSDYFMFAMVRLESESDYFASPEGICLPFGVFLHLNMGAQTYETAPALRLYTMGKAFGTMGIEMLCLFHKNE